MDKIRIDDQLSAVDDSVGEQQPMARHARDLAGMCPYLRSKATLADHASDLPEACYASSNHFVPSNVHQSSCCLNPANFVRCPYYLGAMGKEKRQIDFQLRKRSAMVRLRDQFARLLSFRRNPRKKRRRIHLI